VVQNFALLCVLHQPGFAPETKKAAENPPPTEMPPA